MRFRAVLPSLVLSLAAAAPPPAEARGIQNIRTFLEQCPDRDPAFSTIARDFELRRDGLVVPTPTCTEPVNTLPTEQYTDELIVLQGLRVIFYMDRGQSGHLPWTNGTLYDWMKTKIGGINIVTGQFSSCCSLFGGKLFINVGSQDDVNRAFDKSWFGLFGNIDLYAHETRHVDGFGHSSCCGIPGGCDDAFDPANLSSYGIQWWLNRLWLDGTINVGYGCLPQFDIDQTTLWLLGSLNGQFRDRFCTNNPSIVRVPLAPGGPCVTGRRRAVRR